MRLSQTIVPTLKEAPAEAEVPSHIFMVRGGYMRKVAAGIYSFLPLGWKVVQKVSRIIREEMNRAGASEVFLPAIIPAELWQESGRWEQYGAQLLRLKDRKGGDFVVGPTHEEVICALVRGDVRSWRQLPLNLYQIQTKFRDELRPRAGLMRGREFIMKDAYSFHVDETDAKREYENMYKAYQRIFTRCGLAFRAVEADTGAIGGSMSHEFQVLAETGEDALVACDKCDYAANVEQAATRKAPPTHAGKATQAMTRVATPGQHTIAQVSAFLKVPATTLAKTLIYLADGAPIAVLVRGDREVNEIKLKKAIGAMDVLLASDAAVKEVTGAPVGFAGPVGLKIPVYVDDEVAAMNDFVVGANAADAHTVGVNVGRDFQPTATGDYRQAAPGDACPRCDGGHFKGYKGVEVGHVFYLGQKYSKPMGVTFLDVDGKEKAADMGCYGIGVTRIVAAAIEQNHDKDGIVWPVPLAPYEVAVLELQQDDDNVIATAKQIYEELQKAGIDVLYDDRDERAGVKFKDADLIGIPYRIAVGKKGIADGIVELKLRKGTEVRKVKIEEIVPLVVAEVTKERT
ncbi:MAG TPA: proline--tRNA ligase [Polyangia bacterium]|jgi:prolyl-tRNA synthetase|nr:proline--tRNA ligase [Polyangia bacterium]